MNFLLYLAVVFVAGMMAHRFVSKLSKPMTNENIWGLVCNASEIMALGFIFKMLVP